MGKVLSPLSVGRSVFVRLVTHYYTGRIVKLTRDEIVLADAAWIADTGRFADALARGTLSEVEPYPGLVTLSRGALVDCCEWKHALPRTQK